MNGKIIFLLLISCVLFKTQRIEAKEAPLYSFPPLFVKSTVFRYSPEEIQWQMEDLETTIELKLNSAIEDRIKRLVTRGRVGMEHFLGRSARYFPLFEEKLKKAGLPEELKFLAVVESALKPGAVSGKGAAGLWQLMPETAREYGLIVEKDVDERLDPNKSTEAALSLLTDLYQKFGDWKLAIAAYNCGSSRVSGIIKRRKSKNYAKIKRLLPRQTRHYVEKYTAMAYLMSYYHFYNLRPRYPDYNLVMTQTLRVYKRNTFQQIGLELGVSVALLQELNPSYSKSFIPANKSGNYLILPKVGLSRESLSNVKCLLE